MRHHYTIYRKSCISVPVINRFLFDSLLLRFLQSNRGAGVSLTLRVSESPTKMMPICQNRWIQQSQGLLKVLLLLASNPWGIANKKVTTADHERINVKWLQGSSPRTCAPKCLSSKLTHKFLQQQTKVSCPSSEKAKSLFIYPLVSGILGSAFSRAFGSWGHQGGRRSSGWSHRCHHRVHASHLGTSPP